MYSMTVVITDKTAAAQSLAKLLISGSQTGYTCVPSAGYANAKASVAFLSIQAGKANAAGIVYVGDANVANDGSRQGHTLLAGDFDIPPRSNLNNISLRDQYVRTDTNNSTFDFAVETV